MEVCFLDIVGTPLQYVTKFHKHTLLLVIFDIEQQKLIIFEAPPLSNHFMQQLEFSWSLGNKFLLLAQGLKIIKKILNEAISQ